MYRLRYRTGSGSSFWSTRKRLFSTRPVLPLPSTKGWIASNWYREASGRGPRLCYPSKTPPSPHQAVWISMSPIDGDVVWTVNGAERPWVTTDDGTSWTQTSFYGFGTQQRRRSRPTRPTWGPPS